MFGSIGNVFVLKYAVFTFLPPRIKKSEHGIFHFKTGLHKLAAKVGNRLHVL